MNYTDYLELSNERIQKFINKYPVWKIKNIEENRKFIETLLTEPSMTNEKLKRILICLGISSNKLEGIQFYIYKSNICPECSEPLINKFCPECSEFIDTLDTQGGKKLCEQCKAPMSGLECQECKYLQDSELGLTAVHRGQLNTDLLERNILDEQKRLIHPNYWTEDKNSSISNFYNTYLDRKERRDLDNYINHNIVELINRYKNIYNFSTNPKFIEARNKLRLEIAKKMLSTPLLNNHVRKTGGVLRDEFYNYIGNKNKYTMKVVSDTLYK